MKDYTKVIQLRADKSFNLILAVSVVIAFIASLLLFIADVSVFYAGINFVAGLILFSFFLFANVIETSYKILVMIAILWIIAIASFVGGGFTSAFITILIISNGIGILFLHRKQSVVISIASIGLLFILAYFYPKLHKENTITEPVVTWGLQIVSVILLLIIFHISIYFIKTFLLESIEGLEKAVKHSNQLAYYDQLTKLPNRHKFKLDVTEVMQQHPQDGFILLFSLKTLSLINSILGQEFGDQTLVEITELLNDFKQKSTIIARIGGNEFAIWMGNITEDEFLNRIMYVLKELKSQDVNLKKKLQVYVSYAILKHEVNTLDECYQKARLTLTYAKNNDIFGVVAYNDKFEEALRRKEALKDRIEKAMKNDEFTLYYQAKYDARTNQVIGVEGLARWHSKELGLITPYEFIPIIESLNMAKEFGDFVINQACKDFEKLQSKYNDDICVSINISPSHIIDSDIVGTIRDVIKKNNVSPDKLIVEITEDIIIKGIEEVKPILKALRDLKVKLSLDDFGTGYSSLNYLGQLDFDEIKIDKSFVDQIEYNKKIYVLVENILNLSKQFNLSVIAEGVETIEQKNILGELGCYNIQGYYFAKPEAL